MLRGRGQVNVRLTCDPLYSLILQDLQTRAETYNDPGFHRLAGLCKERVWGTGRMTQRQSVKDRRELLLGVLGKQPVSCAQVLFIRIAGGILIHIQNQRLEKVSLTAVPEMIAFAGACISDDDIGEDLGHERIAVEIRHTVPGIAVFRVYQVKNLHIIPVFAEQLRGIRVKLALAVRDDHGLAALDVLKQGVADDGARLHRAGGTEDRYVSVEPGILRHADCFPTVFTENGAFCLVDRIDFENLPHFRLGHPGCSPVDTGLTGVEAARIFAPAAKLLMKTDIEDNCSEDSQYDQDAFQPVNREQSREAHARIKARCLDRFGTVHAAEFLPERIVCKQLRQKAGHISKSGEAGNRSRKDDYKFLLIHPADSLLLPQAPVRSGRWVYHSIQQKPEGSFAES